MNLSNAHFSAPAKAQDAGLTRPQIGALCWRMRRGKVQFMLITSRDTGRWIIPKGWLIDGRSAAQSAEIEAWEEAGVKGQIAAKSLGEYTYNKLHASGRATPCQVAVFALRVSRLEAKFPEKKQRRRKWVSAIKAAHMVAEAELSALLRHASHSLRDGDSSVS